MAFQSLRMAGALAVLSIAGAMPPLVAPAAAAVDTSDPQRFIQTLTGDGFAAIRTRSAIG